MAKKIAPWVEVEIRDVDEISKFTDALKNRAHLSVEDVTIFFRGQAKSDWTLKPTFLRNVRNNQITAKHLVALEAKMIENFKKRAHLYHSHGLLPNNSTILDWATLMQHHGAPTRVLDWTTSPYVALYFAVEKELDYDGAIWFFGVHDLTKCMERLYGKNYVPGKNEYENIAMDPNAKPIMHMYHRDQLSERMIAQQSVFTICQNIIADHADIIGEALKTFTKKEYWLWKIVIHKEHKIKILTQLYAMNVNASSLFPGADGVGKSLRELMNIETGQNITENIRLLKKQQGRNE